MMCSNQIPYKSFPELSDAAFKALRTEKIWLWNKDNFPNVDVFSTTTLKMGSSAEGKLDFSAVKTKVELDDKYQKIKSNTDVSIPDMYWKFMKEVRIGDTVVVFSTPPTTLSSPVRPAQAKPILRPVPAMSTPAMAKRWRLCIIRPSASGWRPWCRAANTGMT